jgi:hypothetical protein
MRIKEIINEAEPEPETMSIEDLLKAEKDGLIPHYWENDDEYVEPPYEPPQKHYYHGTTVANAKKILKTGLDPRRTKDRGEHCLGYVFLARTPAEAEDFAPGGIYGMKDGVGVILEITPPISLSKKIRTDLGEFLRCPVHIPPRYIKIFKYTNKKNNIR